jgi:cell division protein FtsB
MFNKLKFHIIYFLKNLRDVRFLGQAVFVVIVLLVSWSTAKAIQSNYELQRQVAEIRKKNEIQQLKNDNLKIRNQYLNTNEYLELAARSQLGKAAPGETVIIVPKEVAMQYTVENKVKSDANVQKAIDEKKPAYQRNLEAWGKFFFRR